MNQEEATHAAGTSSGRVRAACGERGALVFARREGEAREHTGHQKEPADHVLRTSNGQNGTDEPEVRRQEQEDEEEGDRLHVAAEQGRQRSRTRAEGARPRRSTTGRASRPGRDATEVREQGSGRSMRSRPQAAGAGVHEETVAKNRSGSVTACPAGITECLGVARLRPQVDAALDGEAVDLGELAPARTSRFSSAPRLSSSCSTELAPTSADATRGSRIVQASAI